MSPVIPTVKFGSAAATGVVKNSTTITAVSPAPASTAGSTVDITVTTQYGTSATSEADKFYYNPGLAPITIPSITGISPSIGPIAGGTQVTITGSGFTGATAVRFGVNAAASFKVNGDMSVTAVSPSGSGKVDITVTTANGFNIPTPADQFTYLLMPVMTTGPKLTVTNPFQVTSARVPAVTGISPQNSLLAGGTQVSITGSGFTGAAAVNFGATQASSFTVNSDTSITATSPAESAGTVDITVTTPKDTSAASAASAADKFTYTTLPLPNMTTFSPKNGPTTGGTTVSITGSNYTGATGVSFGNTPAASFKVNSDTSITAVSPAAASISQVELCVFTPGGSTGTQFIYYAPAPAGQTVFVFSIGSTKYTVNGQSETMATAPTIIGGRTFLPMRCLVTPLGAYVGWDPTSKEVTIVMNGNTIELWIGSNQAEVNGQGSQIDSDPSVAPVVIGGCTMLPLRFITENLGCKVDWDQSTQTVTVTYPAS